MRTATFVLLEFNVLINVNESIACEGNTTHSIMGEVCGMERTGGCWEMKAWCRGVVGESGVAIGVVGEPGREGYR